MAHRSPLDESPASARRAAKRDMAYAGQVQKQTSKEADDRTVTRFGGKPGMSRADQEATLQGRSLGTGSLGVGSPRATRLASPVAVNIGNSSVPLNVNTPNAQQDAAILASPAPVATGRAANQTGNAIDYNAVADRRAQAGAGVPNPVAPPSMGRVVPQAQSDALLGKVEGPNGYGTGSVRMAKAGEVAPPLVAGSMDPNGTGPQRASTAFDPESARAALFAKHPAIFQAGSPENLAFDAHAKQYGLEDAHANADSLMSSIAASKSAVANRAPAGPVSPMNPTDANTASVNAALRAPSPEPSAAAIAGQGARGAIQSGLAAVAGGIKGAVSPIKRVGSAVADFFSGASTPQGYQPRSSLPDPTATPPAQVAGPAAPESRVPNPTVPPAQSPPVAANVDQELLKKRKKQADL